MKKQGLVALALAASLTLLAACAGNAGDAPRDDGTASQGNLVFTSRAADRVSGSAVIGSRKLEFLFRKVANQVFTIEVWNGAGLSLTSDVDYTTQQVLLDGFKTETGEDATLTAEDKSTLEELGKAIAGSGVATTAADPERRGVTLHSAGSAAVRALSVWRETPVAANLRRDLQAVHGRTVLNMCGWLTGYGVQATHDCWDCWDNWDGWNYVNIGPNGYGVSCYPDSCSSSCGNYGANSCGRLSCEQSGGGSNGTWQWGSNGDKYGACTVWDTNVYSIDCLDHDHCVRNDHGVASGWCDDMIAGASDDQTFGTECKMMNGCGGRCGGSFTAGGNTCYCDAACDGFGDCCSDYHAQCNEGTGSISYLGRSVARTYNYASRGGSYGQ